MMFAFISDASTVVRRLVESSDPDDLAARVQAVLVEFGTIGRILAAINLAGAGDGHKWVVEFVGSTAADMTALDGTTPLPAEVEGFLDTSTLTAVCYKASDVRELAVQRDRAITAAAPLGVLAITDEQLAGAAQGLQYMGLILLVPNAPQ